MIGQWIIAIRIRAGGAAQEPKFDQSPNCDRKDNQVDYPAQRIGKVNDLSGDHLWVRQKAEKLTYVRDKPRRHEHGHQPT